MQYQIACIAGDGIGPEVSACAIDVLQAVASKYRFSVELTPVLMGGCAIDATGVPLPQETIDICKKSDAVLLGAVGGWKWDTLPGHLRPEAGLLGIRAALGLYANLRPAIVWEPLKHASPLKSDVLGDSLDVLVVRELTGGIYFGERGRGKDENGLDYGYDTEKYNSQEVQRIAHVAFKAAMVRGKKLCSVDKANVLESSRFWREQILEVAKEYPEVELSHMYVDNAAMQLIRNPRQFDVIVTSNIFGDILSDEASMLTGSIGMLPSASFSGSGCGLYEPIHGSAPDIAGQNIANPLATILSVAMMLRYSLNQPTAADSIEIAVGKVLAQGLRTKDIASHGEKTLGTKEMGQAVIAAL